MRRRGLNLVLLVIAVAAICVAGSPAWAADEVELSKLVEEHRDNFAPDPVLKMLESRTIEGLGAMKILDGGTGLVQGTAKVYSDASEFVLQFEFKSTSYPRDGVTVKGEEVIPEQISAGDYGYLADFLYNNRTLARSDLIGSVLSAEWPFLKEELPEGFEYEGIEKIDGKELHEIKFEVSPYINSFLYFDPETFRHVRSVHRVAPANGDVVLTEEFMDFQRVENMELPTLWAMVLEYRPTGKRTVRWELGLRRVAHNMPKQE